jgi:2-polyprenyl-3-methyl-5-hydroxy-6-metoxy-1,4-benzoquinol methylase
MLSLKWIEGETMKEKEAYARLAELFGVKPDLIRYFIELQREKIIINPLLPESVTRLGQIMNLKPGQNVLDLACGKAGVSLPLVFAYNVKLTGIDLTPDFIHEAWARAEASGLYHLCNFKNEDASQFVAAIKKRWDAVLMLGASFIWSGLTGTIEALSPLVIPDGHLVIGEPYYHQEAIRKPEYPFMTKDETTAFLTKAGKVIEILDDGEEGWQAYYQPEVKALHQLRADNPKNKELLDFLDELSKGQAWEMENLGWAVWVIRV